MYESPINKIMGEIKTQMMKDEEGQLMVQVTQTVGYDIDKDELIKALNYDRHQYKKGYEDGLNADRWIPVSERLPETDNENSINKYNVLLWVKNKSHPEREPQIYLGKLRHVNGDNGSGNFWGIETKPCEWTIWGWCYFNEPEVIAWMPLPEPYKAESEVEK